MSSQYEREIREMQRDALKDDVSRDYLIGVIENYYGMPSGVDEHSAKNVLRKEAVRQLEQALQHHKKYCGDA